jgi:hypothetical protein
VHARRDWAGHLQQIKECSPEIGVVVLSIFSDLEPGAMASGADAFVTRADLLEVLLRIRSR